MNDTNSFAYREFLVNEKLLLRAPYNPEMTFYNAVKMGEIKTVSELCSEPLKDKKGLGTLSTNPLVNFKYHFVVTAAMLARTCISGGMGIEESYGLSDYYIRLVDKQTSIDAISQLHPKMCFDYTMRMKKLRASKITSKPIIAVVDYICSNLSTQLSLDKLSEVSGLDRSYLSRLFKKQVGSTIGEYILDKKIETAENMLKYSNYSISFIANDLAFSSQSYFSKIFRERVGMTPRIYRSGYSSKK